MHPKIVSIGIAFQLSCLSLIVLCVTGACRGSSNSYDAWFDIDQDGNLLVSVHSSIYHISSTNDAKKIPCLGREVALLPNGHGFLFEREDTIWKYEFGTGISNAVVQRDESTINWWPAYVPSMDAAIFARADEKRQYAMGGLTGKSYDVYACKTDGTDFRRITSEFFYDLSISPRCSVGSTVFFVGTKLVGSARESRVYKLDLNSGKTSAIGGTDGARYVSVSQDGKRLVFMSSPEYYSIYILDINTGVRQQIKSTGNEYVVYPVFDNKDNSILYLEDKDRSGKFRVKRLSLKDKSETEVWVSK